jgi:putative alpha-1,2-mannosidase
MASLITALGGPEAYVSRLSFMHNNSLVYIGDEQAFLSVFQFHYGGRPALSAERSHSYIPSQFNNTEAGLAGNDDSGAMGSYIALSMMGLWPVPGQNVYLITPPFFQEVNITNGFTGNVATVRNINFDSSYNAIYIQSATLNGKTFTQNWITHDFYTEGGVLELVLGDTESSWGTAVTDLPPSLTSYQS